MGALEHQFVTTVVARWFVRLRGRAMAVVTAAGVPLSGVVLPPLLLLLISHLGWRLTWAILGLGMMALVVPTALWFLRRRPEDLGLRPDGDIATALGARANARRVPRREEPWTVREALATPSLWLLMGALNLGGIGHGALMVHQIPYMTDKGFSAAEATLVISLVSVGAVTCKFLWGFLAERFPFRYLMAVCFIVDGLALVVFMMANTLPVLLVYAVMSGLVRAHGLWMGLAFAEYYGTHSLGALRGVTAPIQVLTYSLSPLFAGVMYDLTKSYVLAFQAFVGCVFLAAVLVMLAKPPRRPVGARALAQAGERRGDAPEGSPGAGAPQGQER
jgi:sugar phosphate permease